MKTPVSELLRILSQTPASYPVIIVQEGVEHEIELIEFGHNPPNLTIKLAPKKVDDYLAGFERWWQDEGIALHGASGKAGQDHARKLAEIAWSNGKYLREHGLTPLPEPEATIAELNAVSEPMTFTSTPSGAENPFFEAYQAAAKMDKENAGNPLFAGNPPEFTTAAERSDGNTKAAEPMTPQDVELSAANYKMQAPEPVAPVVKPKKASTKKVKTS